MVAQGFASETEESQSIFRKLLIAMANPGTIEAVDTDLDCPGNLHQAAGAILLTLLDYETPFWTDLDPGGSEIQWVRFHSGAPLVHDKKRSQFALVTDYDHLPAPGEFNKGTIASPDQSTTLIVQVWGMDTNGRIRLSGPGIETAAYIKLRGIKEAFFKERAGLAREYPLGVDMIFVCDDHFICLPRTTRAEVH